MTVPDPRLQARVAALEQRVHAIEFTLARNLLDSQRVQPLSCRLWLATLNEDMGASTAGEASADLVGLDETDTGKDVTLIDPWDIFTSLENGAEVVCIEQVDVDGTRYYMVIQ